MLQLEKVKVGFIGFGNMAQAIAKGLIVKKTIAPEQLYACAKNWTKLCAVSNSLGIHPCQDAVQVVTECDIIFIAVKPAIVNEVLEPIKHLAKNKILISVVAGFLFEDYQKILLHNTWHISTLPNTPVAIGEGIFICEEQHSLPQEVLSFVESFLSTIAVVQFIETRKLFNAAGTIIGCGPAFVSMFIEALGDAAVKYGISRPLAYKLASQMVAGTGKLLSETGIHPAAMKDAVCSPGGTTILGVTRLEKKGLRAAVIEAIDAIEGR